MFFRLEEDTWTEAENASNFPQVQGYFDDAPSGNKLDRIFVALMKTMYRMLIPPLASMHLGIFLMEWTRFRVGARLRRLIIHELILPLASSGDCITEHDRLVRNALRKALDAGISSKKYCYLIQSWLHCVNFRQLDTQFWEMQGRGEPSVLSDLLDESSAKDLLSSYTLGHGQVFVSKIVADLLKMIGFLAILAIPLGFIGVPYNGVQLAYAWVILPLLILLSLFLSYAQKKWLGLHSLLAFFCAEAILVPIDYYSLYRQVSHMDLYRILVDPMGLRDIAILVAIVGLLMLFDKLLGRPLVLKTRMSYLHFLWLTLGAIASPIGYLVLASFLASWTRLPFAITFTVLLGSDLVLMFWGRRSARLVVSLVPLILPLLKVRIILDSVALVAGLVAMTGGIDAMALSTTLVTAPFGRLSFCFAAASLGSFLLRPVHRLARSLQALDAELNLRFVWHFRTQETVARLVQSTTDRGRFPIIWME